jgi:hypothetical protein
MRYPYALAAAALFGLSPVPLSSQAAPGTAPAQVPAAEAAARAAAHVTATGCLQLADDKQTYVLRQVQSAPGTVDSTLTSPTAGTSATGEAPSGSVTGRTPTGSTAVVTPGPLPDAGTPGETASPASPTFQQPTATATAGTVARPDSERREYRLLPGDGVDLKAHVGHTVEVTGSVRPAAADATPMPGGSPKDARKAPETRGAPAQPTVAQALVVERLRHVSGTCAP